MRPQRRAMRTMSSSSSDPAVDRLKCSQKAMPAAPATRAALKNATNIRMVLRPNLGRGIYRYRLLFLRCITLFIVIRILRDTAYWTSYPSSTDMEHAALAERERLYLLISSVIRKKWCDCRSGRLAE